MKTDLRNMDLSEIEAYMIAIGEKKFRAKQVYDWVIKGADSWESLKNLPKGVLQRLQDECLLDNCKVIKVSESKDGTIKTLSELQDGEVVESVFMSYKHGYSICISTQVGCRMGCTFCASTLKGVKRNLTAGEYLGQIYALQNLTGKRISNVVLMGSGEPLDNYDETVRFLKMAIDEKGLNLSARNITLSTCGLVDNIRRLALEGFQITLAISLHNPFDEERQEIMPVNRKYNIASLVNAVNDYIKITGRRVTFEYALINGVNDKDEHANALGRLLKGMLVHVNLIPVNAVEERGFKPTQEKQIQKFKSILSDKYKVTTTVRRELGSDINAACGQLRNEHLTE